MFFEYLIVALVGVGAGIITGLIPGLHINLVSVMVVSFSPKLLEYVSVPSLGIFVIAMSITHTFLDIVPAIFLGAPESETVMAVLPGHQLLLEGKGYEAVKLTIIGALISLIIAIALFPIMVFGMPIVYDLIAFWVPYLLIIVMVIMVWMEPNWEKRAWATLIFFLSGVLGLIVLTYAPIEQPLLPMLSGLFGISMLTVSIFQKVKIPKQNISDTIRIPAKEQIKAISAGTFSGTFVSFMPGLGPAQAAIIGNALIGKISNYGFLILVGSIGTVNMVVSLVSWFSMDKARNGAVVALMELFEKIDLSLFLLFTVVALLAAGLAAYLSLFFAKVFCKMIEKVNYLWLCSAVIIFVTFMVFFFSSWLGLLVLIIGTAIGIIPNVVDVKRSHSMGCLILPVILFLML